MATGSRAVTMQLRIRHTTGYLYAAGAAASYNEARMTPLTTSEQTLVRSRMEVSPAPWSLEYRDYWGTTVTAFEVHEPHGELTVVATSVVDTSPPAEHAEPGSWAEVAAAEDEWCEFLRLSDWVRPSVGLSAELEPLRADAATPTAYARAVCGMLYERIAYLPGSTTVTTTAADAWAAGSGVCQDIAHLSVGALRAGGVPARYVSGYLHPAAEPEVGVVAGDAESHAWVEWWDGEWRAYDPTNDVTPGERHVVVGRGRDYSDCPPLRGIYSTRGESELFVAVELTRLR